MWCDVMWCDMCQMHPNANTNLLASARGAVEAVALWRPGTLNHHPDGKVWESSIIWCENDRFWREMMGVSCPSGIYLYISCPVPLKELKRSKAHVDTFVTLLRCLATGLRADSARSQRKSSSSLCKRMRMETLILFYFFYSIRRFASSPIASET